MLSRHPITMCLAWVEELQASQHVLISVLRVLVPLEEMG
jgi:hypothetical protein